MRSTTTTTGSRKRGRESTPVRATRLKTGRRDLLTTSSTEDLLGDDMDNKSSVNGPLLLSDGLMLADQQQQPQPPPLKNRKQQQQVANGFPVTVFPPADNNNSSPPPTAAAPVGAFQSPRHNNKNSRLASSSSSSSKNSSQATVRLDNNKPEPAAARKEAPPTGHRDDDAVTATTASIRRQQMKEAFQPWVMQDESGGEDRPVYKKVAVVEDFFDIIYREHVEFMNNSGGRPPTGKHAGQKRTYRAITEIYAFLPREAVTRFLMQCADCQRRGNGGSAGAVITTDNIDLSLPLTSTLLKRATLAGVSHQQLLGLDRAESSFCSAGTSSPYQGMTAGCKVEEETLASKQLSSPIPNGMASTHSSTDPTTSDVVMDDHSPGAIKDEDDEDDDDVEDRIDTQDPERLKAFNMFVRLFVDENLDRMVPISRQPREKVQAIIDSCLRQFPEFGERARKRIRTYLKSCRRHKRTRDSSGGVQMEASVTAGSLLSPNSNRPMPPHLTSAVAEQILAQACENENQNAKRLRLGLEPISQPLPAGNDTAFVPNSPASQAPEAHSPSTISSTIPTTTASGMTNLFRPAFGPYQRSRNQTPTPTHQGPTDLSTKSRSVPNSILGPPTSNGLSSRSSPLPHKLNAAEILAVRQLVTGYRESAAFLLRSADELEQLLHQQHNTTL
uniref:EOG090X05H5 n=1 Tax=Simocephalus serrulatus TaxID=117539 RepID=A0A4Y7NN16_9CRUS|nr:EOG090X05H5 [Simocephalus serrulatus]